MNRTGLGTKVFRMSTAALFALFFLFPLYAMADFSTRNLLGHGRTLAAWRNLLAGQPYVALDLVKGAPRSTLGTRSQASKAAVLRR